jgi:hypothetical protein
MSSNKQQFSSDENVWNGISAILRYGIVSLCLWFMYLAWPASSFFFAVGVFVFLLWRWWQRRQPEEEPSLSEDVERWASITGGAVLLAAACASGANRGDGAEYWLCVGAASLLVHEMFVLELLKGRRRAENKWAKFFNTLRENLFELLLIFTIVAAVYAGVSAYLSAKGETDCGFLELKRWDDRLLYIHEFLKGLKFSTVQTVLLCVIFLVFQRVEMRFTHGGARASGVAWKIFRQVTKQAARICLVVLFAASFTFLGSNEKGVAQQIRARVRDFEETYTTYQNTVGQNLEIAVKRELIARTWAGWDQRQRKTIQRSFLFRERARNLYGDYNQLRELFKTGDANTGEVLKRLAEPLTATVTTEDGKPQSAARASDAELEGVSLATLKSANTAAKKTLKETQEEIVIEPAKTMEEELGGSLMDLGFEQAKNLAPILDEINAHFPGAGEFLGAVWDAANETFLSKLKEAQKKVQKEGLISGGDGLKDMIMKAARTLSAESTVDTVLTKATTGKPFRGLDEGQLNRLEQSLKSEAHQAEVKELAECARRLTRKSEQLDELHRKLGVDTVEGGATGIEEGGPQVQGESPSEIDVQRASYVSSQGLRRNFIGGSKLFDDAALNGRLLSRFAREERYDRRLAEIAGKASSEQANTLHKILGAELENYRSIYKARENARNPVGTFDRGGRGVAGEEYRDALKGPGREIPHEIPHEIPRVVP